jgi:hypothetical protein
MEGVLWVVCQRIIFELTNEKNNYRAVLKKFRMEVGKLCTEVWSFRAENREITEKWFENG